MDQQSPCEVSPKVTMAISMVAMGRLEGLIAALDSDSMPVLISQCLCRGKATKHTSWLVISTLSYQDALHEILCFFPGAE